MWGPKKHCRYLPLALAESVILLSQGRRNSTFDLGHACAQSPFMCTGLRGIFFFFFFQDRWDAIVDHDKWGGLRQRGCSGCDVWSSPIRLIDHLQFSENAFLFRRELPQSSSFSQSASDKHHMKPSNRNFSPKRNIWVRSCLIMFLSPQIIYAIHKWLTVSCKMHNVAWICTHTCTVNIPQAFLASLLQSRFWQAASADL